MMANTVVNMGHTTDANYQTTGSGMVMYCNQINQDPTAGNCDNFPGSQAPHRPPPTQLPWRPNLYYSSSQGKSGQSTPDPQSCSTGNITDDIKVPPVFAAARNSLYTRYTQNDWLASCQGNALASERVLGGAEHLRLDTMRLANMYADRTKRTQANVSRKLGERIGDVNFWKTELLNETALMQSESNALNEAKTLLKQSLEDSEKPLHISQECLYHREKRMAVDLCHDMPEKALIMEVGTTKRVQERMRNTLDRANVQLGLNRAAQHELEKDTGDKFISENLDTVSHGLRNNSLGIAYHEGVHRIDNSISNPETWAKYTNCNIQRSQQERAASKAMRAEIECTINGGMEEIWRSWNDVNTKLNIRIQETTDVRNQVQMHLNKNLQEIFDMERNIDFLKKAIGGKDGYEDSMKVAHTRLDTRLRRPNVELCRDEVHKSLVCEVGLITETVDHLNQKLKEAENTLQALLRAKSAQEQDLAIKNNTLFIDREKCLAMRKIFPMSPRIVCL